MEIDATRPTRPTMRDVAAAAGVSLKTVSRVINDEAGVAATTADRVLAAIAELRFERNDLARNLRRGRSTSSLGLVIEDVSNPFYSAITQAVESAARDRGLLLITGSCEEDAERERELVTALLRRRVDALLIVPAGGDHSYVERATAATPVVYLDRPPGNASADTVLLDNAGGARAGIEHLLAHGHRRIACVADDAELYTARERLSGYLAALDGAGIAPAAELVCPGHRSAEQAEATVARLLELPAGRRPTAIFTANNRNTVGALHALEGRRGDVALLGFDDFELADLLGASVVRSDPAALGAQAAALAFARLDGETGPPRTVVVPTEIVPRGSGELEA